MTQEEAILVLSYHSKLGAQSIKKLLAAGPKLLNSPSQLIKLVGEKLALLAGEAVANYNPDQIREDLQACGIGYVTYKDKLFPRLLSEIPDCPVVLFAKGDIKALNVPGISVVGSRKYSSYGARMARHFSRKLSESGLSVVSGLALGIDAMAHQAVVEANGITIGVLACGLDRIYPVSNNQLARSIIECGGVIISEYPPGTEPFRSNFPARNRIIAGLTPGTLVVEAAKDSGALITATAALEYNRDVYAIPGPIDAESSEGCNYLIQQGAKLTASVEDITTDFGIEEKKSAQKAIEYLPETETEKVIVELAGENNYSADDLFRLSGYNVAEVSYALTMLEMKGILENVNGAWKKKM